MSAARYLPSLVGAFAGAFAAALIFDVRGWRLLLLAVAASAGGLFGTQIYGPLKDKLLPH